MISIGPIRLVPWSQQTRGTHMLVAVFSDDTQPPALCGSFTVSAEEWEAMRATFDEIPVGKAPQGLSSDELRRKLAALQNMSDRNLITDEQHVKAARGAVVTFTNEPAAVVSGPSQLYINGQPVPVAPPTKMDQLHAVIEQHNGWTNRPSSSYRATVDGRTVTITVEVDPL